MKSILAILLLVFLEKSSSQQEFICEHELAVVPHPVAQLCNLYVVCVFGLGHVAECPAGQIFFAHPGTLPPFGACEYGYLETCERTTALPQTTTTTPPITHWPTTTVDFSPPTPPGLVPDDACEGRLFGTIPYPGNCWNYILCILQRPHLGECEPNQIYHPNWNFCIRGNRDTCEFCLNC